LLLSSRPTLTNSTILIGIALSVADSPASLRMKNCSTLCTTLDITVSNYLSVDDIDAPCLVKNVKSMSRISTAGGRASSKESLKYCNCNIPPSESTDVLMLAFFLLLAVLADVSHRMRMAFSDCDGRDSDTFRTGRRQSGEEQFYQVAKTKVAVKRMCSMLHTKSAHAANSLRFVSKTSTCGSTLDN
jgi:hypothetical protein